MKYKLTRLRYLMLCLIAFSMCISCKNKQTKKNKKKSITAISSKENYNDILLDSNSIPLFFKYTNVNDSIQNAVIGFYKERDMQFAWINSKGLTVGANNFYTQLRNYKNDFADKRFINAKMDSLLDDINDNEKEFLGKKKDLELLELLLTTTFFQYANLVFAGITNEPKDLQWYIPRKKKDYTALLESIIIKEDSEDIVEPVNKYYTSLKEKLRTYREIEKSGRYPIVQFPKKVMVVNDNDSIIPIIKLQLKILGDFQTTESSTIFTDSLQLAIKQFQNRMGLTENGLLDKETIFELNVPLSFRIKQMMINMERLRWVPVKVEKDYLLVNIPEFKLHIFENDQLAWETNIVVGKVASQTTIFKGNISEIVFNPYWNVPYSIYKKEIKPRLTKSYLARNNMERYNGGVRQKPGPQNSLGRVKFLFPNNYNIYLHDTPSKSLFEETKRGFSHGCIRVQEPQKLALYLLRKEKDWNIEKIETIWKTNIETPVKLTPPVPVYIVYFTSWVDSKGSLNFRNDLYDLDKKLEAEIFAK